MNEIKSRELLKQFLSLAGAEEFEEFLISADAQRQRNDDADEYDTREASALDSVVGYFRMAMGAARRGL